jgi:OOP family OmpA-OmpF porin
MNITADLAADVAGVTIDDEDTVTSFTVGYRLDDNFSAEVGALGSGEVSISATGSGSGTWQGKAYSYSAAVSAKAETDTSYMFGVKYSTHIDDKFDVYGKAGLLYWDTDYTVTGTGTLTYDGTSYTGTGTAKFRGQDGSDPYYGVGGSYAMTQDYSILVDYIRSEIDTKDIDGLSVAASFDF